MSGWIEAAALLGVIAGAAYWLDGLRSKELAREAGKRACDDAGAQFLDDTVVLTRVRLKRLPTGTLAFRREYRFEFSMNGAMREHGAVVVHGGRALQLALDLGDVPRLH